MTAIAYRDGVLASDSRVSCGDWIKPDAMRKITRLPDGSLFAAAGEDGITQKLRAWLIEPKGDRPEIPDCNAIQVFPDGRVLYYDGKGCRWSDAPFIAIGSGMPVMLGALYSGASATEAVAIACLVDPYSGGDVQFARIGDDQQVRKLGHG